MSFNSFDIEAYLERLHSLGSDAPRERQFNTYLARYEPLNRAHAIQYLLTFCEDNEFMELVWKCWTLYRKNKNQAVEYMMYRISQVMITWDILPYELGLTADPNDIGFCLPWDHITDFSREKSGGNRCIRYRALSFSGEVERIVDPKGPSFLDNFHVRDARELDDDYWKYDHPSPFRKERPVFIDYDALDEERYPNSIMRRDYDEEWDEDPVDDVDDGLLVMSVEVDDRTTIDEADELEISDFPSMSIVADNVFDTTGTMYRVEEQLLLHAWSAEETGLPVVDKFSAYVRNLSISGRNKLILSLGLDPVTLHVDWFIHWAGVEEFIRNSFHLWTDPKLIEQHSISGDVYLQWLYCTFISTLVFSGDDPQILHHLVTTFYAHVASVVGFTSPIELPAWKIEQKDRRTALVSIWDSFKKYHWFPGDKFTQQDGNVLVGYYTVKSLDSVSNHRLWFKQPVSVFPQLRMWDIVELTAYISLPHEVRPDDGFSWYPNARYIVGALRHNYGDLGLSDKEAFVAYLGRKRLKVAYDLNQEFHPLQWHWETKLKPA